MEQAFSVKASSFKGCKAVASSVLAGPPGACSQHGRLWSAASPAPKHGFEGPAPWAQHVFRVFLHAAS
eukprot:1148238-Pelagomonas_calceolata.AAC.4